MFPGLLRFLGRVQLSVEMSATPWVSKVSSLLPPAGMAWRVKRAMDVVGAAFLLVMFSPMMVLIALLVKLTSAGRILFAWDLLGVNGTPIRSYKFRTMIPGAEALEADLRRRGRNEMQSVYFKLRDDPRVTPVGRLLRKSSLDELPSLWSVVKGDLSLVGPRPVRLVEAPHLQPWHFQRFLVRPGLTSPWVVDGKGRVQDFDGIVASDVDYIRNWSLWRDVRVLLTTVSYILSGKNY